MGNMVESIRVWSKQHRSVYDTLMETGRYVAKRDFVHLDLEEHAPLVLEAYDWLVRHSPGAAQKPPDAELPVWLSYEGEATMMQSENTVIFELCIEKDRITPLNIAKWGAILNFSYIPLDGADEKAHRAEMAALGLSDAKACMSQFYPQVKAKIVQSWDRLFDENVKMGNELCYGLVWELKREWIRSVQR